MQIRDRRWLVEGLRNLEDELSALRVACVDDNAQGEIAEIVWSADLDARRLIDEGWNALARNGTDDLAVFAAHPRTVR